VIPKTITVEWLHERGACSGQVELFERTFGKSRRLTLRGLTKAAGAGLSVGWLALHLKAAALAEYDRVKAAALAEYDRVTAPALAEYNRVTAAALWAALQIEWEAGS
jgi:hypothetical protein